MADWLRGRGEAVPSYVVLPAKQDESYAQQTMRRGPGRRRLANSRPVKAEVIDMPGKKHLRGVSSKEPRQYEHIKQSAQRSGRYGGRAKEVAARTVLKKHKAEHHRKGQ